MTSAQSGADTPFIGIDFGTTKTMVAEFRTETGLVKAHQLGRGSFETPTSIYVTKSGEMLFGDDADDEGVTDSPNHVRRFKMSLGKTAPLNCGRLNGTAIDATTKFLSNIRSRLEREVLHRAVDRVILTVPAMFGPAQRKDLTTAAQSAGFTEIVLVAEPIAAGIAYCHHHGDLANHLRFLVLDWGGGTFDLALMERSDTGEIKVVGDFVAGLSDIGGEDFDDDLWLAASNKLEASGIAPLDSQPQCEWGKYRRDLRRAKERLSSQESVSVAFVLEGGRQARVSIERKNIERIISKKISRGASFVAELVARCRENGVPPEFILLVGGTSRIPLVRQLVEEVAGVPCRQWSEGRESIAIGAALHSHAVWGEQALSQRSPTEIAFEESETRITKYTKYLELAFLDKVITSEEAKFLEKERISLGLSVEEAHRLQVQVFGSSINDLLDCLEKLSWATVLASQPDPAVVTDAAARGRMTATRLPWKIRDTATGIVMLLVPPGEFMMGSPENEVNRQSDESQHRVTISKAFYLSQSQIPQEVWQKVMGANPSQFKGSQNPVETVLWDDCQAFCGATGLRLPSEAEWEYACRAGTTTPFSFGATITPQQVNYDGNYPYGSAAKGLDRQKTVVCGSLPANQWGFREMHGNVWEWCQDGYSEAASTTQEADETEIGARVLRGGGWDTSAIGCRASYRGSGAPSIRNSNIGCRFARTA